MKTSADSLIYEALSYEATAFEHDEAVDGTELVDWFADWRRRARSTLPYTSSRIHAQLSGAIQSLQALETETLIQALDNGGLHILAGDFNVMVFKRTAKDAPCKR